jgi:hypothetical protein
LNAFGLHRKKEETLALILEDDARKNPGKSWISNRQIYVGSGTVLTCGVCVHIRGRSRAHRLLYCITDPRHRSVTD